MPSITNNTTYQKNNRLNTLAVSFGFGLWHCSPYSILPVNQNDDKLYLWNLESPDSVWVRRIGRADDKWTTSYSRHSGTYTYFHQRERLCAGIFIGEKLITAHSGTSYKSFIFAIVLFSVFDKSCIICAWAGLLDLCYRSLCAHADRHLCSLMPALLYISTSLLNKNVVVVVL